MGMVAEKEDEKSDLATRICEMSARKSPFIDWYVVLGVDENADMNGVKKQYHKLALQLHPDKNKHSKAETAFKLVSEAYLWLSDGAKRAAFDRKREAVSCHQQPHTRAQMRKLKARLKQEADIIEKCVLANASASRRRRSQENGNGTKPELPVFNPSDYYQSTIDRRKGLRTGNRCMVNDRAMSGSPVFENRSNRGC